MGQRLRTIADSRRQTSSPHYLDPASDGSAPFAYIYEGGAPQCYGSRGMPQGEARRETLQKCAKRLRAPMASFVRYINVSRRLQAYAWANQFRPHDPLEASLTWAHGINVSAPRFRSEQWSLRTVANDK